MIPYGKMHYIILREKYSSDRMHLHTVTALDLFRIRLGLFKILL